jgi:TonB-dependent starch-binding outer membrane protein SusC
MLGAYTAQAQIMVKGRLTDETGAALPGVSIVEKGTTNGANSDADGRFTINVKNAASVLIVSYVGFATQQITVGSQTNLNIAMQPGTSTLEEVVVVGYGTQKKATLTGAVVAVQGERLVQSPAADLSNSLSGRLPGLVVVQTNGEPGRDGANINIRGFNTLGNNSPLVVIDGIPDRDGGLGRLAPRDIESISVLKDASAAIYGARAANGAIIVTTKRGKSGKPTVTYDFNQGITQPTRFPKMANAREYAMIMNELPIYRNIPVGEWGTAWNSMKTTGLYDSPTTGVPTITAQYSPDAISKYGSDPWRYPDTDWYRGAFRTWAPQSRHNLQILGGSDNVKYMASLGYVFQDAIYRNSATNFSQYNLRTNLDAKINNYVKATLGIMLRREQRRAPTAGVGSIFRMLMRGRPMEPQVWPNGLPGPDIENGENPYVITTNATGYVDDPTDFVQTNASLEITNPWISGLRLTLSGAADNTSQNIRRWETPWTLYTWDGKTIGADGNPQLTGSVRSNIKDPRLTQSNRTVFNTNLTALLNYDRSLGGGHQIGALAGVTRETFEGDYFLAFRRFFLSTAIDQLFAGGTAQQNTDGTAYQRGRLGYYGRVQYGYKEKYLAEFLWRYDGSYIFPKSGRFGFFPSVSVGWTLSNEDFFKVKGIDFMKLRASYGQMGNDQVAFDRNNNGQIDPGELQEFAFLSTYGFGQYPINGELQTTLRESLLANPNFTWERANNFNIGLDATFLNNKFDVTLEYFRNRRDQILIQKTGSTPASSGISSLLPPTNAGIVTNAGFEFSLNYNHRAANGLQVRAGVNGGYARNNVNFMDEVPGAPSYQRMEGKPIRAYLVYNYTGVFRDQADIDANRIDYSAVTNRLLPGDMKFEDINGDGKITADDATRINKNINPTFNFGANVDLRYKNFDLNILFQGATGAALFIRTESGDIGNYLQYDYQNRWSIDNPNGTYPRLASRGDTYYTGGNFGNNTYFLRSKDYLRLKNIELGYTLPVSLVSRIGLGSARVFVNGLNVLTFDGLQVYDPEITSESGQVYPQTRVLNSGITVSF